MNQERVASLLSAGLAPSQVATIVGCSPGLISQLKSDPDFMLLLEAKNAERVEEDIEEVSLSAKYSAAEHALVKRVMEMAPAAELRDVTSALRVISERQEKMKSRLNPVTPTALIQQTIVNLTLPSHAIPRKAIEMTTNQEVISIGSRALAPMPSDAVTSLFSKMNGGKQNEQSPSITNPESSSPEASVQDSDFLNSNHLEQSFLEFAHGN